MHQVNLELETQEDFLHLKVIQEDPLIMVNQIQVEAVEALRLLEQILTLEMEQEVHLILQEEKQVVVKLFSLEAAEEELKRLVELADLAEELMVREAVERLTQAAAEAAADREQLEAAEA
jgi:hypothetical protein